MEFPKRRPRVMDLNADSPLPALDIIATNLPDGMVVIASDVYVGDHPDSFHKLIANRISSVLDGVKFMRGDEIGAEWRTANGLKLAKSDEWTKECYFAVCKATDRNQEGVDAVEKDTGGFHRDWNKEVRFKDKDYENWLNKFNEMCEYVDRVKRLGLIP